MVPSMPLPLPNPAEGAAAVLASAHRHWERFGAQHEGLHFLSLGTTSEDDAKRTAHADETIEQITRLAYHRARQAVLRFVSDLRTVSSHEYIEYRSMLEAAQLMKDGPAETPYMEAIRRSLEANPEQTQVLNLAAARRDPNLADVPNPAEKAIYEAFVIGRDHGLGVLVGRNNQCNGADLLLGKTSADKLIFRLPSENGPIPPHSVESAIDGLRWALMERDSDGPIMDDIKKELEKFCEIAAAAAAEWTEGFLTTMEHATPADIVRFGNLMDTARLIRDDPASLKFFQPLLNMLEDIRHQQLRSADALRMMGYDATTRTFSPRPPVLTTALEGFRSGCDAVIEYESEENPSSPGIAFMKQPSQGEAEIAVRRPKDDYLGPSCGLKGSERPNPTKLEDLGPFYQIVVSDIREKIAPALAPLRLRPVVKTKDAEDGIRIRFETSDGKKYGAVDLDFRGPAKSTLSHATWFNSRYDILFTRRKAVGTNGWFVLREEREFGDFENAEQAIECTIRCIVENDLLSHDLLPKQVRSEAMADVWHHIEWHMIMTDRPRGTMSRDGDGTEHLKFTDGAGVVHVISLAKDDTWTMTSGGATAIETDNWRDVAALIKATVADEPSGRRYR